MTNQLEIASFDLGASGGKVILGKFDGKRIELSEVHRFFNNPFQLRNRIYWDFLFLFEEVKKGLSHSINITNGRLASIGLDTWGVDCALLDKKGDLLENPHCYRDPRTNGVMEKVFKHIPREKLYMRTGVQFMQFNTLFQIYSMLDEDPHSFDNVGTFFMVPDLFNYYLTDIKKCEFTNATTTQMYDPYNHQWDRSLLKTLGVPYKKMAEIIKPGEILGDLSGWLCAELDIKPIPVVVVASHDTASAASAVPYDNANSAFLSSGTWSLLGSEEDSLIINEHGLKFNFSCYGGACDTHLVWKNIQALWLLQECMSVWKSEGKNYSHEDIIFIANQAKAFGPIINTDALSFLNPGDFPKKIAHECESTGQTVPQNDGEIARCILESLALKYRFTFESLQKVIGRKLDKIHVIGGGARNWLLNRFTAEATTSIVESGPYEATSLGNLLLQLIALGEIKDLKEGREVIRASFKTDISQPSEKGAWGDMYERYQKISVMSKTFNL